jgi:hypothetical protein
MLRRVALVATDVSKERFTSIIRVTRIGKLGTTLAVTSNRSMLTRATRRNTPEDGILRSVPQLLVPAKVPSSPILFTLMMEALRSPETSGLTRVTWRHIPKGGILHSHRRENLKS